MDDEKRIACLGMPGYGEQTAGAARGYWLSTAGSVRINESPVRLHVNRQYGQGSLLAQNFNALWCWPLNLCEQGEAVSYFAMIHSDIEPEDFWLDKMIEELEARQLDVLSAVVPIKDPQGLTSTALARDDDDPWRIRCRLTMKEVYDLPETFTSQDVGAPLLLNTGLWVCRFDPAWARQITFTINDRIVYSRTAQQYFAETEPEDWNFSRQCHDIGLRIAATRKIKLQHAGPYRFINTSAWGQQHFDAEHVDSSLVPLAVDGFQFPGEIDGWLSYQEGRALFMLAAGSNVMEIGSYCGRSTICLAQSAKHVTSVDYHDGRGTPRPRNTMPEFKDNLARHGLSDKVSIKSPWDLQSLAKQSFDIVFIDGAHDKESVKADIHCACTLLNPAGLIVFHDYRDHPGQYDGRWDEGVTQAVQEFLAGGAELIANHESLAVVRPPADVLSPV